MAGIFDEVMDGINARENQAPPATPPVPPAGTPPAATPTEGEQKGLHEYSQDFKAKYGERKKSA